MDHLTQQLHHTKLIAGRSNLSLAQRISKNLGVPLTNCILGDFGNTEIKVEILESIRGFNVFIIQTGSFDVDHSINDYLIELLAIINACKLSSAKSINIIIPCYPYARSDKKDTPRVPIMGALVSTLFKAAGVDRIISLDLHAGQIQGFTDIPFDNLYGIKLHVDNLRQTLFKGLTSEDINKQYILASPDNGGVKRTTAYAEMLHMKHVIMSKQRDYSKISMVMKSTLVGEEGAVVGKTVLLVDDMFDTLGTVVAAAEELVTHGATGIIAIGTHGIFSGPAMMRLNKSDAIKKVIVTNSLPQENNLKQTNKLEVVDVGDLFTEVIRRILTGASISAMFSHE